MKLTGEQIEHFNVFGFLRFPHLLSDSIKWITEEFEQVFINNNRASEHDGTKRTSISPFLDESEKLYSLLNDSRIKGIATSILGNDFKYLHSDGNFYVGDTNWHRDSYGHRYHQHIKIALYLDPVEELTGALRVIPGTHYLDSPYTLDVFDKVYHVNEYKHNLMKWESYSGSSIPAYTLNGIPGDVIVFDHNLMHSSWGGSKRRRMLAINLCEHG